MLHATYRARFAALSAIYVVIWFMAPAPTFSAQKGKPLNEQEVIELLVGGVPSGRVAEIVDDRGIEFEFTAQSEQKIRDAGGSDDVVSALKRASQRRADSEQPRAAGLMIKSSPGEAQIYLDDVPKGITSPEGELRLPDLKPGTYKLRVSLLGYQSFEKRMTIAAGDEQTVYVTLVQKTADNPVKGNPVSAQEQPPVTTPSSGIPVPGVKVAAVQFYEGPHDQTPQKPQRVYRFGFDRFTTRSIYWELDLSFPATGRRIDFQVDAVWYKSDGSEMTRQTINAYVQQGWGSSWHTLGYGYVEPGHWIPGTYRVDFFCKDVRVASKMFQID
jgi:hypothetical protein